MPVTEEHHQLLEMPNADCTSANNAYRMVGGSSIAAAFLQKFVEKGVRWGHIDMAGPCIINN